MKATIFSHENIIGTTELVVGDTSMGHMYGTFIPNKFYFDNIQKHVWDFWKTSKPNYDKWYALRLNVQLENGYYLFPAGGYTIDDSLDLPNESKRIDITGLNSHIFKDFFNENPTDSFLVEPWETINIGQKLAYEDELSKEFGLTAVNKSLLRFIQPDKEKVSLISLNYSALCKNGPNDDVLFSVNRPDLIKEKFVVVHLTWTGIHEANGFPRLRYYKTFDDFKRIRMIPDSKEWLD